ncbi:glycosyltransferase family 9 protein [Massilia sp. TS11]|uniref:glycosyltransferase family 9 protein n=1 Tax=Massilia sp. TS11 TaxID=2908003 RepID=UPI001EDB0A37|nr:glycosyltransferase family 9 protein [Massilia sp. TS11]MCG2586856.1 glycosyltransferase family 9 protein [Massilia sp. TS11]
MSTHGRLPDTERILVLRPNAIGDFMFALPALHALRLAYPAARIDLIGQDWHADFLQARPGPVDRVLRMPPYPGVGLAPAADVDPAPAEAFIAGIRAARYDLAIQLYGGGRYSNALVRAFAARLSVGAATPDAAPLDRMLYYSPFGCRRLELLRIVALAGAPPCLPDPELAVTEADLAAAAAALPPEPHERLVLVHPGVGDPRRRWPAARFAVVADALAARGARIVLSGGPQEQDLLREVGAAMRSQPARLRGPLSLSALCGLLARACMLVANDTGPLHMALALGKPVVGIFWLTNLIEGGPLRPERLRAALSLRSQCPVCGMENLRQRCAHDPSFVDDVRLEEVQTLALDLYTSLA